MDIRFINKENEIINCSRLSIKVIGESLIGIDAEKNVVCVERYESEEKAREILKKAVEIIGKRYIGEDILIDLREEGADGESKQGKEEHKVAEGDK